MNGFDRTTLALALAAMVSPACSPPVTTPDGSTDDSSALADASDTGTADVAGDDTSAEDVFMGDAGIVGERPYNRRIPSAYDPTQPTPLVIMLHGYGASGAGEDLYLRLSQLSAMRRFLYAFPDGTLDSTDKRFWNATDACCNFEHRAVDDVAYVNAIIDDMTAHYNVDPRRIFVIGHSNGGFMSHRLACDLSGRIAGIVSLAGAVWSDMSRCMPTSPVAVLDVHGDADTTIRYTGGTFLTGTAYPSEASTMAGWAMRNRCTGALSDTGTTLDLDSSLAGAETTVAAYTGCAGAAVELWTIRGGAHIPVINAQFSPRIYDWLMAHPRP